MVHTRNVVPTFRYRVRLLALVVTATALVAGCDWTAVGFGPANTSFNPFEPALTESSVPHLTVKWSRPCDCPNRALVASGLVYVLDGGGQPNSVTLRARDATSGQARWSTPLSAGNGSLGLSAVANGLVYLVAQPASGSGRVVALDAETGVFQWQVTPRAPGVTGEQVFVPAPVVVDGPLAFVGALGSGGSEVSAIDPNGQVVWSAAPGDGLPVLAADPAQHRLYVLSQLFLTDGQVISLLTGYDEATGVRRSRVVAQISPFAGVESLAFSNGLVIGSQSNLHGEGGVGAFALHPDTGALAWSGNGGTVSAVTPNVLLEFNLRLDPTTTARDTSTGAVLWQARLDSGGVVAGNLVYGFRSGANVVLRISDGSVVTTPALAEFGALTPAAGHLYVTGAGLQALAPG